MKTETKLPNLNLAIIVDWLTITGGAEKVILSIHKLFPNAPIYTPIYNPEKVKGFEKAKIHTSYLQKIPFAKTNHQLFLPFYPSIFENFNLDEYDLIISSSHSCSKGLILNPKTLHINYCHSPMRYAWEDSSNYIEKYNLNKLIKFIGKLFIHKIRIWDRLSADRVDHFIANSNYIKQRIKKYYRRDSTVIHPFIHNNEIKPEALFTPRKEFYLAVGRLTAYKKFDLLIETFNKNGKPLIIVGQGSDESKLKSLAKSNIIFKGFVNESELNQLYLTAKALIYPQIEDFGIIPLEAQARGCPIIFYKKGGALETITEKTGIAFNLQTVDSINEAIRIFESKTFNTEAILQNAQHFNEHQFQTKLTNFINQKWQEHQNSL